MIVRYYVEGLGEVEHDLLGMGARALEPGPVLNLIGKALQEREREAFESGGFGQWAPLAGSTISRKGHDRILYETGALMESLTGGEGESFEVNGSELLFGTDIEYAGYLKAGTSRMPARDPIPEVRDVDLLMFSKAIQTYIVGAEREEFGTQPYGLGRLDPFGL